MTDSEITGLAAMGHQLKEARYRYGDMQAVLLNKTTKSLSAASDRRGEGRAVVNAVDLSSAKPYPAGQIRLERIWSRIERPQGSGQDSPETLGCVTTAWMQEVEQRREQLPRGNKNKEKSLFKSPHPSLLPEGEGVGVLKSSALTAVSGH